MIKKKKKLLWLNCQIFAHVRASEIGRSLIIMHLIPFVEQTAINAIDIF